MPHEILYTETYGSGGDIFAYIKPPDQNGIVRINSSIDVQKSKFDGILNVIKGIILPQGYPESVSKDYASYQLWDTLQAFCSTISNTLSTQAVLKGVGVGNEVASPTSAAITWILKDGTGMGARILFAWASGSGLDADCKKWRLFADILNDLAMCVEITVLPFMSEYSLQILCLSTSMKAIVGVAGGATRAAITQHQAIVGNTGDVSAKDGSQETCVNLLASLLGVLILSTFGESNLLWHIFFCMTILHLYANYRAVKSLNFVNLNSERFALVVQSYMLSGKIPDPAEVNLKESVLPGSGLTDRWLCGYSIRIGCSLKDLTNDCLISPQEFKLMSNLFKSRKFMIFPCPKQQRIYIVLDKQHTSRDVFEAYFHAFVHGISSCYVLGLNLEILAKKQTGNFPISRLKGLAQAYKEMNLPKKLRIDAMISIDQQASKEGSDFVNNITKQGWSMTSHHLQVNRWRGDWSGNSHELYQETC